MNDLEESLHTLRQENELEKQEIVAFLDHLIMERDLAVEVNFDTSLSNNAYITELCKYEQQVNHKLTEVKYILKTFIARNKPPICKPVATENHLDSDALDIETLKADSMMLIKKMEKYLAENKNDVKEILPEKCVEEIDIQNKVKYPYVSKSTLEQLSDHTKCLLEDLSNTHFDTCEEFKTEELRCNHFPKLQKYLPWLCKPCKINASVEEHEQYLRGLRYCLLEIKKYSVKNSIKETEANIEQIEEDLLISDHSRTFQDVKSTATGNVLLSPESNKTGHTSVDLTDTCSEISNNNVPSSKLSEIDDEIQKNLLQLETNFIDMKVETASNSTEYCSIEDQQLIRTEETIPNCEKKFVKFNTEEIQLESDTKESNSKCVKLNNDRNIENEYSSSISESEAVSDNDKGYCIESDLEQKMPDLKKKKKQKIHRDIQGKMANSRKTQPLKGILRVQNNLLEEMGELNITNETNSSDCGLPNDPSQACKQETVKDCNLSANLPKPVFSAEEKILKLGLDDRWTRFEQTREVALIPDIRLQPSVSDNEKMMQIQNRGNKFEIRDRNIPKIGTKCVFSHVESPSEFYIHLDNEESKLIDCLNELITQTFKKTKTPYRTKFEAFSHIGRYCCSFVRDEKTYYRAEVVDWCFDQETKIVIVQLVDYGNYVPVHFKHLRELTTEFCFIPKIAVKCFLPMLYPPGSKKSNLLTEWPATTVAALWDLSGFSKSKPTFYKIFYAHKEGDMAGVDMYELGDQELNTIGQILIDLSHAVQIILPTDDPSGVVLDDEDIRRFEDCNNINEVVLGYDPKDEGRVCRFTRPDGTCFKKDCKLEHVKLAEGGYTSDKTLIYSSALNELKLPDEATKTRIRFTEFVGGSSYYINLVKFVPRLEALEKILNDKTICSTFEPYKMMPAYGEIVLVRHWSNRWQRAKVRHHSFDDDGNCTTIQAFMVDYGDVIEVPLRHVRHIRTEYLELGFQAVECILHNYKAKNDVSRNVMRHFFYENMILREFDAQVMGQSDMLLCLRIFHKNCDLGDILAEKGFLTEVNKHSFPSNSSLVVPG